MRFDVSGDEQPDDHDGDDETKDQRGVEAGS